MCARVASSMGKRIPIKASLTSWLFSFGGHVLKPSKEKVREWQQDRIKNKRPLPDQAQIKRELGFDLAEQARKKRYK